MHGEADQLRRRLRPQAPNGQLVDQLLSVEVAQGFAQPRGPPDIGIATRGKDEHPTASRVSSQVLNQIQAGLIGPVQIVDDDGYGTGGSAYL